MKQILLTRGQFAIVDDEDFERLDKFKWQAEKLNYGGFVATRNTLINEWRGKRKKIRMARIIMNAPKGKVIDHRNHNTLDNQKHNLLICTCVQNGQNRLPNKGGSNRFKGVSWQKGRIYKGKQYNGKWRAHIRVNKKGIHLGLFENEIDAALAYDSKAKELFSEFARTNF